MPNPAPYTVRREAAAIERTLADVRLVLWLATAFITAKLDAELRAEGGTGRPPQIASVGVFLFYSLVMWVIVRYVPRLFRTAVIASSFIEVLLITWLILDTYSANYWVTYGSSRSPFYLWYVFYIMSVSLRFGLQMSLLSLAASVLLYTWVSMYPKSQLVYVPGFSGDTVFLFVLAFLFGHIAERQRSYQARLAVVNEAGVALASLSTSREITRLFVTQTVEFLGAAFCWFTPDRSHEDSDGDGDIVAVGCDPKRVSDFLADLGDFGPSLILQGGKILVSNKSARDSRIPASARKILPVKSLAAIPLYVRDVPVGVLYAADKQPRGFSAYDIELMGLVAAQAAPLIENIQLLERLNAAAASEERLRIARDLHDNFLQTLSAVKLYLERSRLVLDKDPEKARAIIDRIHEISTQGLADVRSYLSQLRLVGPEPSDFGKAAEACVKEASARGGFVPHVDMELKADSLTPELSLAAFQILRELLNNAVNHARAANVWVTTRHSAEGLTIEVRDDGVGFTHREGRRASDEGHLGLVGVQERANELGGRFVIESGRGKGTTAVVTLPSPENHNREPKA